MKNKKCTIPHDSACPSCVEWQPYCTSSDKRNRNLTCDKESWTYYQCNTCQTIQIDEYMNVDDVYEKEKIHTTYQPLKPLVSLSHRILGHPLKSLFGTLDFNGWNVLDIGCGNGQKLYDFYTRKAAVCGIEISEEKLQVARRYMPEGQFYNGFIETAPFPQRSFDLVIADNVVEHLQDPDTFVRKLREFIKPTGRVVLFVPYGKSYTIRRLKQYALNIWPPFHINLFTKDYFKQHFPDITFTFQTRSHFFTLQHSLKRAGNPTWLATVKALFLLPFAQEELVVIYS